MEQRRFTVTMHSPLAVHSNGLPPEVYDPGGLYTSGGIFRLKIIIKTSLVISRILKNLLGFMKETERRGATFKKSVIIAID